jgi:hypothetical protein
MRTHRVGGLDRRAAERLLGGESPRRADGENLLGDLLGAAAAPGRDRELAGEEAALSAFRAAHHPARAAQTSRRPVLGSRLTRHLPVKVAAAAAAVVALSGVAAAAVTGTLPAVFGGGTPPAGPTSSVATPLTAPGGDTGVPPAVLRLCQAYTDAPRAESSRKLDDPAFGALVDAAGGKDKVPGYCAHPPSGGPPGSKPDTSAGNGPGSRPGGPPPAGHGDTPAPTATPAAPPGPSGPAPASPGATTPSPGGDGGAHRGP